MSEKKWYCFCRADGRTIFILFADHEANKESWVRRATPRLCDESVQTALHRIAPDGEMVKVGYK